MSSITLFIRTNPIPWAVGELFTARVGKTMRARMGRNDEVYSYQQAVKESVDELLPVGFEMWDCPIYTEMQFWRQVAAYESVTGKIKHEHVADLTNMVKSTEDALQGLVFKNDRDVFGHKNSIVSQGPTVEPQIVIRVSTKIEYVFDIDYATLYREGVIWRP